MEAQAKRSSALARWVTGRQSYFLKVHGAPDTDGLSIFSVHAVEKLGEPYRITLELTAKAELKRADYLGKFAKFTIEPPFGGGDIRTFDGCIMRFTRTRKTRDFCAFKVVVESTLARLNLTKATRIYQNSSAPDIIVAILKRHKFLSHQYTLKLRKPFPKLAFHMQYQMTDWAFIHLVMRQGGIFCYARTSEFGDVVTFADDVDGYVYRKTVIVPYREISGLDTGTESVYELEAHSESIPASTRVADYNPASAWERFSADTNLARDDKTTYGESYTYGTHHLNATEAQWEARLRHEEALSQQIRFEGKSTNHDFFAGLVVRLDEKLPDAPHGLLMTEVIHQATREKGYFNEFKAIPCERPYRIPLDETNWPKIAGTLSARITTRHETDYAQPDENGLYTARFDFDFDTWPDGGESVPMRLAKPYAGAMQTGFHFPPLRDTEVAVAFVGGDPRCPYIAHMHHHSQAKDLIYGLDGWNTRASIRTPSNNKLRLEDARGKEGVKLSTDYGGKTQLNMGYLVDSKRQKRGEGFELRSDERGSLRAGKGLFLSADAQPRAGGQALDMSAAMTQLQTAQSRAKSLAEAVTKAKAVVANCEAQQSWLETQIKDLQQAVLLASAPHGVALTSGEHMQFAAGGHLFTTAGGNADTAVGGNYTVAAGNAVSLFANAQGIKAIAAEGKIDVQAQGDALNLAALKGVTVSSTDDAITLTAKTELMLYCGGSYVKLTNTGVEIGSPFDIMLKGPMRIGNSATKQNALPLMPKQEPTGMQLWHAYPNGEPVKNAGYRVDFSDGTWRMGKLDENGRGMLANVPRGGGAVKFFEDGYPIKSDQRKWAEPKNAPNASSAVSNTELAPPSLTGPAMATASQVAAQAAPETLQAVVSQAPALASAAATGGAQAVAQTALSSIGQQLGQSAQRAVAQTAPPLGSMGQSLTPSLAKSLTSK
ncbi:Rhs element Vgr protein [Caballeronia arvi]|uniref:Rhs element Vgr protein n=1 Tax=Caballeronia arvi TaxID=1777135 RepID=A0A158JPS8_9BURK|nr:type VI secretion system Vgr family protein [Caballeronia arvi]SAL70675.1 Rhs element Vgr protein [Caballeronia arvi]